MATIFYSVAGQGRGHATRARTIVDDLRRRHEVILFAPGVAYNFLDTCYRETDVRVHQIPGLLFHYREGVISPLATAWEGLKYLTRMQPLVRFLEKMIRLQDVDLIISDFEPALPRAAQRCGVPVISLDHQHLFTTCDLSSLPWNLRWKATLSEPLINFYCPHPADTIVSSFFSPPLKPRSDDNVIQTGVMLRPDIVERRPTREGHVLAYLRKSASDSVLQALRQLDCEVRVYGQGVQAASANLRFRPISDMMFLDDLTSCDAIICNAGNQLLGEAVLRKPVFAMPEPNQFEQFVNAHFLKASGGGDWREIHEVQPDTFREFFERRQEFLCQTDRRQLHGNPLAIGTIENRLSLIELQRRLEYFTRRKVFPLRIDDDPRENLTQFAEHRSPANGRWK